MLPLEGILFAPSWVVVPAAALGLLFLRRSESYPWLWKRMVIACAILAGLFALQVWSTPFYSERDHSPANPGGPTFSATGIGVALFATFIMIPSFLVLVALACLPPAGRPRLALVICILFYVAMLAALLARKNAAYMADYEQTRRQERIEHEQWRLKQIR